MAVGIHGNDFLFSYLRDILWPKYEYISLYANNFGSIQYLNIILFYVAHKNACDISLDCIFTHVD